MGGGGPKVFIKELNIDPYFPTYVFLFVCCVCVCVCVCIYGTI